MSDVNNDTVYLLQECNAGVKMGVDAIDEVLGDVQNPTLRQLFQIGKEAHQRIGSDAHRMLNDYDAPGKDPNAMARGMSWLKTNWKMTMDDSDATVADLITDGCNMGVKSLNRYINQYPAANEQARQLTDELVQVEQQMAVSLSRYL